MLKYSLYITIKLKCQLVNMEKIKIVFLKYSQIIYDKYRIVNLFFSLPGSVSS